MFSLALALLVDLVDPHLVVPARHGEEVGPVGRRRRREGEIGDAVGGRIAEGDVVLEVALCLGRRGRRAAGGAAEEARHLGSGDG